MSVYTKRILFAVVGIGLIGLVGILNPDVQRLLGLFAFGWMLMDIAQTVFPESK